MAELFKDDWGLFAGEGMDSAKARVLLVEILDDESIVRKTFTPVDFGQPDYVSIWDQLCNELMYENRWFPKTDFDTYLVQRFLEYLQLEPSDIRDAWFRARIQDGDEVFALDQMGAPPRTRSTPGRASPAGIPYLYLASDELTAVSEIRPHTGDQVSVAQFRVPSNVLVTPPKLVDLRDPKNSVSPFRLSFDEEEQLQALRVHISLLERLGRQLTIPVLPHAAAINYIPSQYLCEFIKGCGYDGILYSSSVGNGINLVLFSPDRARAASVRGIRVDRVSVEF